MSKKGTTKSGKSTFFTDILINKININSNLCDQLINNDDFMVALFGEEEQSLASSFGSIVEGTFGSGKIVDARLVFDKTKQLPNSVKKEMLSKMEKPTEAAHLMQALGVVLIELEKKNIETRMNKRKEGGKRYIEYQNQIQALDNLLLNKSSISISYNNNVGAYRFNDKIINSAFEKYFGNPLQEKIKQEIKEKEKQEKFRQKVTKRVAEEKAGQEKIEQERIKLENLSREKAAQVRRTQDEASQAKLVQEKGPKIKDQRDVVNQQRVESQVEPQKTVENIPEQLIQKPTEEKVLKEKVTENLEFKIHNDVLKDMVSLTEVWNKILNKQEKKNIAQLMLERYQKQHMKNVLNQDINALVNEIFVKPSDVSPEAKSARDSLKEVICREWVKSYLKNNTDNAVRIDSDIITIKFPNVDQYNKFVNQMKEKNPLQYKNNEQKIAEKNSSQESVVKEKEISQKIVAKNVTVEDQKLKETHERLKKKKQMNAEKKSTDQSQKPTKEKGEDHAQKPVTYPGVKEINPGVYVIGQDPQENRKPKQTFFEIMRENEKNEQKPKSDKKQKSTPTVEKHSKEEDEKRLKGSEQVSAETYKSPSDIKNNVENSLKFYADKGIQQLYNNLIKKKMSRRKDMHSYGLQIQDRRRWGQIKELENAMNEVYRLLEKSDPNKIDPAIFDKLQDSLSATGDKIGKERKFFDTSESKLGVIVKDLIFEVNDMRKKLNIPEYKPGVSMPGKQKPQNPTKT